MSKQIGDKYTQKTIREIDGTEVFCNAEFEVVTIDTQTQADGSTIEVENSKLIRYLD